MRIRRIVTESFKHKTVGEGFIKSRLPAPGTRVDNDRTLLLHRLKSSSTKTLADVASWNIYLPHSPRVIYFRFDRTNVVSPLSNSLISTKCRTAICCTPIRALFNRSMNVPYPTSAFLSGHIAYDDFLPSNYIYMRMNHVAWPFVGKTSSFFGGKKKTHAYTFFSLFLPRHFCEYLLPSSSLYV